MVTALVGLGSNLGDRQAMLHSAIARLADQPGVRLIAQSGSFASAPVGGPSSQPEFLNAAVRLETSLSPAELLETLLRVETELGRQRGAHWGPRSIDLDLLLYGDRIERFPRLLLPHPRLAVRRFVLEPAAEVAAEMVHPTIGWSIGQLLAHLRNHRPYLALTGPTGAGKTEIARRVATALKQAGVSCQLVEEEVDHERLARYYAAAAGRDLASELEFDRGRAVLLSSAAMRTDSGWLISDFWFEQSLAYADVWLSPEERAEFQRRHEQLAAELPRPKLIVALDAPPKRLKQRILARGRPYEKDLDESLLARLRASFDRLTRQPGLGPVLHLAAEPEEAVIDETVAAVVGMQ